MTTFRGGGELYRADVPFTALCTVRSCVVLSDVCMVDMYGQGCTGGNKPFLQFRGTGVCIRTGTIQFSTDPIRYGAN